MQLICNACYPASERKTAKLIPYAEIHEGNFSYSNAILALLKGMKTNIGNVLHQGATVVNDAGIATKDNLKLWVQNGYYYLCVSHRHAKNFNSNKEPDVIIKDELEQMVKVKWVYESTTNTKTEIFIILFDALKKLLGV